LGSNMDGDDNGSYSESVTGTAKGLGASGSAKRSSKVSFLGAAAPSLDGQSMKRLNSRKSSGEMDLEEQQHDMMEEPRRTTDPAQLLLLGLCGPDDSDASFSESDEELEMELGTARSGFGASISSVDLSRIANQGDKLGTPRSGQNAADAEEGGRPVPVREAWVEADESDGDDGTSAGASKSGSVLDDDDDGRSSLDDDSSES